MNRPAWLYYTRLYHGSHRILLVSILVSVGQSLVFLPMAYLVQQVFDQAIPAGDYRSLVLIGLAMLALHLIGSGASLWTRYVTLRITKDAIQRLREELLKKLYTLPRSHYSTEDRGQLHTVIVQDTERVDIMSNALLAQLLPAFCVSLAICGVLLYTNWLLFLVTATLLPIHVVTSRIIARALKRRVRTYHESFEAFSSGILFVVQMMDLTHIQSAEEFETRRQRQKFEELSLTSTDMAWLRSAYRAVQDTMTLLMGIVVLIVGGISVVGGHLTLGELVSYYALLALLQPRLGTMVTTVPEIIEGNESLSKLYRLLNLGHASPYSGKDRIPFNGGVGLRSVHFGYDAGEPLLRGVDLDVRPGATTALIGPNGSGKTTIANLILGFYRPQEGQIFADDHPYTHLDIPHLRREIGVVSQDLILFPGTILENITYGNEDRTQAEVIRASELATAHAFIEKLPHGYDTLVGEQGVLLSGGQRQRIAIARALLHNPKLLILDEPTNHLDNESIHTLLSNLRQLDPAPASLVISHDRELVREAQYVYMLEEGRIVPAGNRGAIIARQGAQDTSSPGAGHGTHDR